MAFVLFLFLYNTLNLIYSNLIVFTPLLHAIDRKEVPLAKYEYGSRGPEGLDAFVDKQASYKRASQYSVSLRLLQQRFVIAKT